MRMQTWSVAVMLCMAGLLGCAEQPKSVLTDPAVSGDYGEVQERAVPMRRSGFMGVPRYQGPRTELPPKGGTMNFQCNMTSCTCQGDADCNNMFTSNVCGRSAVCDTSGNVECSCLRSQ